MKKLLCMGIMLITSFSMFSQSYLLDSLERKLQNKIQEKIQERKIEEANKSEIQKKLEKNRKKDVTFTDYVDLTGIYFNDKTKKFFIPSLVSENFEIISGIDTELLKERLTLLNKVKRPDRFYIVNFSLITTNPKTYAITHIEGLLSVDEYKTLVTKAEEKRLEEKRIAEEKRLEEERIAEEKRLAELQAQKERAEADKKLEAECSIALKTQRDKLAQDAAAKASEVRKLKMEKQGVLGQINVIESKKKALLEIRQGVENRSIELYNQMNSDIESEFKKITNKSFSTVELGSNGQPTEIALTRRENQRISAYNNLHEKFYADCESVKQATMSQQNTLLQEIKQDQTNLTKLRTVNSMGDELKVSFGPYEGSQNGWNTYLSLYFDGILVYTDTVIVSYEAVAGKKAPNMETELNDAVIEEYTNNVDMYNSLLTRGDPILYFVLEYSVKAKSEDSPSEYDATYKNLKVYNTLSDVVVQNIALNKIESKVMKPQYDLKIYDGIVENEKNIYLAVNEYIKSFNKKIDTVAFDESNKKIIVEAFEFMTKSKVDFYAAYNIYDVFNFVIIPNKKIKMLQTEVTQKLYKFVMGENPSYELQEKRPVENVSFYDAIYFCNKLSAMLRLVPVYSVDGITDVTKWDYVPHKENVLAGKIEQNLNANGYRLPTVEEWKYAARGGEDFKYAGSNNIDEVAWYTNNSNYKTHEVGKKYANGYGLFDMSGNVGEWCWDHKYYSYPCFCGGSCSHEAEGSKVDSKINYYAEAQDDIIGFRIVRSDQ